MGESSDPENSFSIKREEFLNDMRLRWHELQEELFELCPSEWHGFHFQVDYWDDLMDHRAFIVRGRMKDAVSNRLFGDLPQVVNDELADLYCEYRRFSPADELTGVRIEQDWDKKENRWRIFFHFACSHGEKRSEEKWA